MAQVEARLLALGIELPVPPVPVAAYVPVVETAGGLVYISGQGPVVDNKPAFVGRVGRDLTLEQGQEAARLVAINLMAQLKAHIGDLDRVKRIVKLTAWVNSDDSFDQQPFVVNGASELLVKAFGECGRHARTALGTNVLPFQIAVEADLVVELLPGERVK
jgi:enamine deaminase RidA (YjgF/YER057c/UK114 family)